MEYNLKEHSHASVWKWVLIYVLIGAVVYGLVYYFLERECSKYTDIFTAERAPKICSAYFFLYKGYDYTSQNYQNQTQNNSETADWETYRNDEYGFAVDYPGNFVAHFIDYRDPADLIKNNIDLELAENGNLDFAGAIYKYPSSGDQCGPYDIKITPIANEDINAWFSEQRKFFENPFYYEGVQWVGRITSVEDVNVNGKTGKKYSTDYKAPHYNRYFGIINNGKLYEIKTREGILCNNFDNIISTFKFIK